jgi:hypothetical protein
MRVLSNGVVKAQCERLTFNEHPSRGGGSVEGASVGGDTGGGRGGVVVGGGGGVGGTDMVSGVGGGGGGVGGTDMDPCSSLDQKSSSSRTSILGLLFSAAEPPIMRSRASTKVVAFICIMLFFGRSKKA